MPLVDNLLIRTGGGNPSPMYNPELSRFNGWQRQIPTFVRGIPRGRMLDHPGHTPARPLEGRDVPVMESWQVPAFPQLVSFSIGVVGQATERHTSAPLPTPSIITRMSMHPGMAASGINLQVVLASTVLTTDAQIAACPWIFKLAPEFAPPLAPWEGYTAANYPMTWEYPLNIPIPNGPRNRIAVRAFNPAPVNPTTLYLYFHVQPL